jgi:hypothetical protein
VNLDSTSPVPRPIRMGRSGGTGDALLQFFKPLFSHPAAKPHRLTLPCIHEGHFDRDIGEPWYFEIG